MSPRQQGRGGAGGKRVSAPGRALFPSSTVSLSTRITWEAMRLRSWIPKRPESFKRTELSPSSVDKEQLTLERARQEEEKAKIIS